MSAALLSFEIYVGKEDEDRDNSALAVCDRLVTAAGLTGNRGQAHVFKVWLDNRGYHCINRQEVSRGRGYSFLKLSNGARNGVKRGWYRKAVLNQVGFSNGLSVKRNVKGQSTREVSEGPRAQRDCITFFNAVDRSDRDSADWTTIIRTNRYYIRILCWVSDRVVHTLYIVIVYCAHHGIGMPSWKKYQNKHTGQPDFQIDLGIGLLNYGIGLD